MIKIKIKTGEKMKRKSILKIEELPLRDKKLSNEEIIEVFGGSCYGSGSKFQNAEAAMFGEWELCSKCCSCKCSDFDSSKGYKNLSGTCA
jgi:hypothetical protein